jgi:integrase/recombinase XerD
MLRKAVESYLAVRRSAGFDLKTEGDLLYSFARFSEVKPKAFVDSPTAIEWAGSAPSLPQRARRLGVVIRFARYIHAEDQRHEIPRRRASLEVKPDGGPSPTSFPLPTSSA